MTAPVIGQTYALPFEFDRRAQDYWRVVAVKRRCSGQAVELTRIGTGESRLLALHRFERQATPSPPQP